MLPAKFGSIWPRCIRGEDFFNISQSEKRINLGGHVCWPNITKMKKLYRGSYIDVSCQVWLHFAKQFQRRFFLNSNQSETRIALGGHICWWNGTAIFVGGTERNGETL
jgi:hypothetical protein